MTNPCCLRYRNVEKTLLLGLPAHKRGRGYTSVAVWAVLRVGENSVCKLIDLSQCKNLKFNIILLPLLL